MREEVIKQENYRHAQPSGKYSRVVELCQNGYLLKA